MIYATNNIQSHPTTNNEQQGWIDHLYNQQHSTKINNEPTTTMDSSSIQATT